MDLNVIPTHRFKTVDEFIKRYGLSYSSYIPHGWGSGMTKQLCGKPFLSSQLPSIRNDNRVEYKFKTDKYTVGIEMLTKIEDGDNSWKTYVEELKKRQGIMDCLIVEEISAGHKKITYKTGIYSMSRFEIYYQPTNNCQLSCIASLDSLLSKYKEASELAFILSCAKEKCGYYKRLYMFDVHTKYSEYLRPLLHKGTDITRYDSTNGSDMSCGLLYIE